MRLSVNNLSLRTRTDLCANKLPSLIYAFSPSSAFYCVCGGLIKKGNAEQREWLGEINLLLQPTASSSTLFSSSEVRKCHGTAAEMSIILAGAVSSSEAQHPHQHSLECTSSRRTSSHVFTVHRTHSEAIFLPSSFLSLHSFSSCCRVFLLLPFSPSSSVRFLDLQTNVRG